MIAHDPVRRYHGLDVLRGGMMLLGVLLHAACSYMPGEPDAGWPFRDAPASPLAGLLVVAIHAFRMPVFFVMAGFFGAMAAERRGPGGLLADRARRIGLPLVVGWVLLFPLTKCSVMFAWLLRGGMTLGQAIAEASGALRTPWSDPSPAHLWFLWYLLPMYLVAATLAALMRTLSTERRSAMGDRLAGLLLGTGPRARRGWRLPVLVVVTWALLLPMHDPGFDTPGSWVLEPRILVAYGFFFAVGWLMHVHRGVVAELEHGAWRRSLAAVAAIFLATVLVAAAHGAGPAESAGGSLSMPNLGSMPTGAASSPTPFIHVLAQGATALAAWLTALAGIGITERLFRRPRRPVRWLVDASYWTYLVHLPLCFTAAGLASPLAVSPAAKMLAVTTAVAVACGLSYAAVAAVVPARRPGAPALPSAHA